ncbi:MAG: hypothetical protein FWF36_05840 [Propionibacteriaceae bacterium]|nr:hypothetical protein [Propionibacteriaceae bacterium]
MPHTHHLFHRGAGFALALLIAAPMTATTASAAPAAPVGVEACAQQNGVYVVVTGEETTATPAPTIGVCVTAPSSGTDALNSAGVSITRDSTGMICALNNYPNPCPATFDGKYWQYYQASATDAENGTWTYATTGSDDSQPQAGWVEGWCYGEQCTPVLPSVDTTATPTTTAASGPFWTIVALGVIVVVLVIAAIVVVRRRRR